MGVQPKTGLGTRWTQELTNIGNRFLQTGSNPPFEPLDDGLVDLRSLKIVQFVKNAVVKQVDLSQCNLDGFGQFGLCTVSQSRFNLATLGTNLGNRFSHCEFSNANLSGAVLRGSFEHCNFGRAKLRRVIANQVSFRSCDFTNASLHKANFQYCHFEDCIFDLCDFDHCSLAGSHFIRSAINRDLLVKTITDNAVWDE